MASNWSRSGSDRQWERYGEQDPYFGVYTDDRFRKGSLTDETRAQFFDSGRAHVEHVLEVARRHVAPGFAPGKILDFGCGVGRTLIPFARLATRATGVDVSAGMLEEARRNCAAAGLDNVDCVESDDALTRVGHGFDLVHSFIVFQHIPVRRGERLFSGLVARLAPGGVGALHVTYGRPLVSRVRRRLGHLRRDLVERVSGVEGPPRMEMNSYRLDVLLRVLQSAGVEELHAEFSNHGGELGVMFYFRRA